MPPLQEPQFVPTPPVVSGYRKWKPFGILVTIVLLVIAGYVFWSNSSSNEAMAATFTCDAGLSWEINTGDSTTAEYESGVGGDACKYHTAQLYKAGRVVFSVANFTDCRDFKSWEDLFNGIDEPFYDSHQTFPAGAPIVSAVAISEAAIPQAEPEEFGGSTYQFGLQISAKSGLTPTEFVTASKCILDHRNELNDTFGTLHYNSGLLSWLALVDETATYGPGDLPGIGQMFSCSNGYTYRTSGESLFALASGVPAQKGDESGLSLMNDRQVAVIGFDGTLYEPDRTNSAVYISLPYTGHRVVDQKNLPAPLSSCVDDRGITLQAYLAKLKNNPVYEPSEESYIPRSTAIDQNTEATNAGGIAPTVSENKECEAKYSATVNAAATEYAKSGGAVSQGLFYSPSLSICVGVVQTVQDNVTNYETFNAETGEMLNITDTTIAFQDWSLSPTQ